MKKLALTIELDESEINELMYHCFVTVKTAPPEYEKDAQVLCMRKTFNAILPVWEIHTNTEGAKIIEDYQTRLDNDLKDIDVHTHT